MSAVISENRAFFNQLRKYYGIYTGGFIAFVILLAIAEQMGMSRQWIGYWFLFATIALYAIIGIMSRTVDAAEYYVAGRRVPAFFNGMATGADWMSAALARPRSASFSRSRKPWRSSLLRRRCSATLRSVISSYSALKRSPPRG